MCMHVYILSYIFFLYKSLNIFCETEETWKHRYYRSMHMCTADICILYIFIYTTLQSMHILQICIL